jgi:transposase
MNLIEEHAELKNQLNHLHKELCINYIDLQTRYKSQKLELIEYKQKANYWEKRFEHLKNHKLDLKQEIDELKSQLKKREQQLFGKKSEKSSKKSEGQGKYNSPPRKRGQQKGSKGHGRRDYSHLPEVIEEVSLTNDCCPCCGLPYEELAGTEDSEILEVIDVRAYKRTIKRRKYKRSCTCEKNLDPQILTAPVVERLLPKSKLGISIWSLLLLAKYEYQQPLYRALKQLNGNGLSLAAGTVTDGKKKLLPFFTKVYDAIVSHSLKAKHWHADETGWKVFAELENKKNNRWYLWIFRNDKSVVYKIAPSRSSQVLIEHFGEDHPGGTLSVDRYSAYKTIAKNGLYILAFCWAHVRRDFLGYSKAYTDYEAWGLEWVALIDNLYHLNNKRLQYKEKSKSFRTHTKELKKALTKMEETRGKQLEDCMLLESSKKLLKSLKNHWDGLTIFVEHPTIPMDNNIAERGLRPCVVGRKNYYGSGSVWSSELSASLFTIFETLKLWEVNVHTWLLAYLQECAMLGGNAPDQIDKFLPWFMTDKQRRLFAEPPKHTYHPPGFDSS